MSYKSKTKSDAQIRREILRDLLDSWDRIDREPVINAILDAQMQALLARETVKLAKANE